MGCGSSIQAAEGDRAAKVTTGAMNEDMKALYLRKESCDADFAKRFPERGRLFEQVPTLSVVLSGGGWRALQGGAFALNELALSGILDCTTRVAGLSGGSWVCYLSAFSDRGNVLMKANDNGPTGTWARGAERNPKAMRDVLEANLVHYLSKENALKALAAPEGSGHFLVDVNAVVAGIAAEIAEEFTNEFDGAYELVEGMLRNDKHSMTENYSMMLGYQFFGEEFAHVKLAPPATNSSSLPDFCATCITDQTGGSENKGDKHRWFEISNTFIGELNPNDHTVPRVALDSVRLRFNGREAHRPPRPHELMAICGQGLAAFPWAARWIGGDTDGAKTPIMIPTKDNGKPMPVRMYDAGCDYNIPVSLVTVPGTGEKALFSKGVSIVIDNSIWVTDAKEFLGAVKAGHYVFAGKGSQSDLGEKACTKWGHGESLRIFIPKDHTKWPVLVYVLCVTNSSTFRINRTRKEIRDSRNKILTRVSQVKDALTRVLKLNTLPFDVPFITEAELHKYVPTPPGSPTDAYIAGAQLEASQYEYFKAGVDDFSPSQSLALSVGRSDVDAHDVPIFAMGPLIANLFHRVKNVEAKKTTAQGVHAAAMRQEAMSKLPAAATAAVPAVAASPTIPSVDGSSAGAAKKPLQDHGTYQGYAWAHHHAETRGDLYEELRKQLADADKQGKATIALGLCMLGEIAETDDTVRAWLKEQVDGILNDPTKRDDPALADVLPVLENLAKALVLRSERVPM